MKIVADENIPLAAELFAPFGEVVKVAGRELCAEQIAEADMLVVRSVSQVNEGLLHASPVKFVGTCTIGTDHVDEDYLRQQGIGFSNAPGCNAVSVVEYVLSCFAQLWRRHGIEFLDRRIGIVGLGMVGGRLYRRLQAMGIDCVGYDPLIDQNSFDNMTDLATVLDCDIVCLHTPLTTTGEHPTRHMIGRNELDQLHAGAVLLNAGRGGVVDNAALLARLRQRQDLHVILDVFEHEPAIDLQLFPYLEVATPHIAGYSFDGKVAGTQMIFEAACRHFGRADLLGGGEGISAMVLDNATLAQLQIGEGLYAAIYALTQGVYPIMQDDQRTRETLLAAAQRGEATAAFDLLRKRYPKRRQWLGLVLPVPAGLTVAEQKIFAALGVALVTA